LRFATPAFASGQGCIVLQPIQQEKTMSKKRDTPTEEPAGDRKDVYSRVTERIIADLDKGIRTWMKPWSAEHTAGRISKPLRHNGTPTQRNECSLALGRGDQVPYRRPSKRTSLPF
jgi:N-terminal domain of anti-restriction factor ArdC